MPGLFVKSRRPHARRRVTLDAVRVPDFRARFNAFAAARLKREDFPPSFDIDAVLELREIDEQTVNGVFALAPFGHGHQPPLFAALGVEVAAPPVVMKEKHLGVTVRQNGRTLSAQGLELCRARRGVRARRARRRDFPIRRRCLPGVARLPRVALGIEGLTGQFEPS
jgi:single-stranded DNA-specific DHH superfamily exonuclease